MNGSRGSNFLRTYGAGGTDPIFRRIFSFEVCSLGHGLVMAGGRMRGKRIFSCFLLGVSYCRLHKGGKD